MLKCHNSPTNGLPRYSPPPLSKNTTSALEMVSNNYLGNLFVTLKNGEQMFEKQKATQNIQVGGALGVADQHW